MAVRTTVTVEHEEGAERMFNRYIQEIKGCRGFHLYTLVQKFGHFSVWLIQKG
jgi:hypothetical protein